MVILRIVWLLDGNFEHSIAFSCVFIRKHVHVYCLVLESIFVVEWHEKKEAIRMIYALYLKIIVV